MGSFYRQQRSEHPKQLRDIFKRFDEDSDGSLTHLEPAALRRSLGLEPGWYQIHALLTNMDSNCNGSTEFEELVEAIAPLMSELAFANQQHLLDVFRSFDRDGMARSTSPLSSLVP
ncbi:probable calcium-binding protein CML15 [Asparagus officinalis]|uniref:probable calcium-binding protein CML15 n=1 Tax=Asparagus officinalis TaxID=4686 RepID=UPI00098E2C97|nr:probable calcium-binding protein CML15 [Asparagus officinalis]